MKIHEELILAPVEVVGGAIGAITGTVGGVVGLLASPLIGAIAGIKSVRVTYRIYKGSMSLPKDEKGGKGKNMKKGTKKNMKISESKLSWK